MLYNKADLIILFFIFLDYCMRCFHEDVMDNRENVICFTYTA